MLELLHRELAAPEDIFLVNYGVWHGPHDLEPKPEAMVESYRLALDLLGRYYEVGRGPGARGLARACG